MQPTPPEQHKASIVDSTTVVRHSHGALVWLLIAEVCKQINSDVVGVVRVALFQHGLTDRRCADRRHSTGQYCVVYFMYLTTSPTSIHVKIRHYGNPIWLN